MNANMGRIVGVFATLGIAGFAIALPLVFRRSTGKAGASRRALAADDVFYESANKPTWAPPAYAFPLAWSVSTLCLAAAFQYLAFRQNHPRRRELLTYLGLHGLFYASFPRVYFDEKSPVLAAGWTLADFAICHLAFYRTLGINRKLAEAFVPVNLWLTLAVPLSLYQAAANRDPFFDGLGIEVGEVLAAMLGVSPIDATPSQAKLLR